MPIENERKFVLRNDNELEVRLSQAPGVTRSLLVQAYLDAPGLRLRAREADGELRHIFSFKRLVGDHVVEIETDIEADDFRRLWKLRRETLQKVRYSWPDGRFHWDIDFFKTTGGRTYFALAEVEMPEHQRLPPPLPACIAPFVIEQVTHQDPRFTSKRLADTAHAERLLAEIEQKTRAA
jgi:CYTH domain-containing protein